MRSKRVCGTEEKATLMTIRGLSIWNVGGGRYMISNKFICKRERLGVAKG